MYKLKLEKDIRCPLEYGLDLFGGRWKTRIIRVLAEKKSARYNVIKSELNGITDAVLSGMLKEMTADGLLERKQYNEIPLRVEYSLTAKGESVLPILTDIHEWAEKYYCPEQKEFASEKVS